MVTAIAPLVACGRAAEKAAPPANVVLLTIDTLRRDHLPFYGYARQTAPSLDELARESVVFDQAIAVHSNTAPAHTSMLSGLYPPTHGVWSNEATLLEGVPLLPGLLRTHGYATAAFVSGATLGESVGLAPSFDLYDARFSKRIERRAGETVRLALEWLEGRAKDRRPFFLFVHLFEPHREYRPPAEQAARFRAPGRAPLPPISIAEHRTERRGSGFSAEEIEELALLYDAEIATADRAMGRLLDALVRLGLDDRTLVVFTADHGETLHDRAWPFDHGDRVYEEQIRIPLTVRLPDRRWRGLRVPAQVSQVDIAPTILELLALGPLRDVAGRSLVPLLENPNARAAAALVFAGARCEPERVPEVRAELVAKRLVHSVRDGRFKLIEYPGIRGPVRQLFDLESDPQEARDIAAVERTTLRRLIEALELWKRETGVDRLKAPPAIDEQRARELKALGYL